MSYELAETQQSKFPYGIADVDRRILETLDNASVIATCSANKYLEGICDEQFWQRWSQIHIPLLIPYQPLFRTWKNFGENVLKNVIYIVRDETEQYYTHPRNVQKALLAAIEDANFQGSPLPLVYVLFLDQEIEIDGEGELIIPESQILYRTGRTGRPGLTDITRDITAYYPNSSHYPSNDERLRLRTRRYPLNRQPEHRSLPIQLAIVTEYGEESSRPAFITVHQLTSDRLDEIHDRMMTNLEGSFTVGQQNNYQREYVKLYASVIDCKITRTSDTGYVVNRKLYPTTFGFITQLPESRSTIHATYEFITGAPELQPQPVTIMPPQEPPRALVLINGNIQDRDVEGIANNYFVTELTLDKLVTLMMSNYQSFYDVGNIMRNGTIYELSDVIALLEYRDKQ